MELLIELFGEVRESKHLAAMPLPLAHFFQVLLSFYVESCTLELKLLSNFVYS